MTSACTSLRPYLAAEPSFVLPWDSWVVSLVIALLLDPFLLLCSEQCTKLIDLVCINAILRHLVHNRGNRYVNGLHFQVIGNLRVIRERSLVRWCHRDDSRSGLNSTVNIPTPDLFGLVKVAEYLTHLLSET